MQGSYKDIASKTLEEIEAFRTERFALIMELDYIGEMCAGLLHNTRSLIRKRIERLTEDIQARQWQIDNIERYLAEANNDQANS